LCISQRHAMHMRHDMHKRHVMHMTCDAQEM